MRADRSRKAKDKRTIQRLFFSAGVLTLILAVFSPVAAQQASHYPLQLLEQPPATHAEKYDKPFACGKPLAPMVDMSQIQTFYKPTSTQSVIDKDVMAAYVKRNRPLMETASSLRDMTGRAIYVPADRRSIGNCIMRQLVVWAKANALLGKLDDNDPKGRRQAILIGIFETRSFADAYSVALQAGAPTADQRKVVEAWFSRLSDAFVAEFTPPREPRQKQYRWLDNNGNTRYWASVAIGFLAVHTGETEKLAWAMRALHEGLGEVADDGSLPLELSRGRRGLHYQNSAIWALTNLLALAHANAIALKPEDTERLLRAARFTADMFDRPDILARRLGVEQERKPDQVDWAPVLGRLIQQADPVLAQRLLALGAREGRNDSIFVITLVPPHAL